MIKSKVPHIRTTETWFKDEDHQIKCIENKVKMVHGGVELRPRMAA